MASIGPQESNANNHIKILISEIERLRANEKALVDALEESVNELMAYRRLLDFYNDDDADLKATITKVKSAIALATGKESA
jgi:GTP1/Obg family GTP-binding protein